LQIIGVPASRIARARIRPATPTTLQRPLRSPELFADGFLFHNRAASCLSTTTTRRS
jgi:hypothetical protein